MILVKMHFSSVLIVVLEAELSKEMMLNIYVNLPNVEEGKAFQVVNTKVGSIFAKLPMGI